MLLARIQRNIGKQIWEEKRVTPQFYVWPSWHLCEKVHVQVASLVAQWLRIRLPMQETQVRALVREDPTCRGATKPVRHNY